jgi:glycosyltransferase involved in cell wall biosynthesis
MRTFYAEHAHKASITTLSAAQRDAGPAGVRGAFVIPNPIALDRWRFAREKSDYLLWVGRMAKVKGPHRAIEAARMAGRRIVLAGPVQPGQEQFFEEEVGPRLDDATALYVGEVSGHPKNELFAHAAALLMPIRWQEPFGMVMIEALAAGTPVIAYPEGAATEIVIHGRNGFLVEGEAEMAEAVGVVDQIDPAECRASVADRYDAGVVARQYEVAYRSACRSSRRLALATAK